MPGQYIVCDVQHVLSNVRTIPFWVLRGVRRTALHRLLVTRSRLLKLDSARKCRPAPGDTGPEARVGVLQEAEAVISNVTAALSMPATFQDIQASHFEMTIRLLGGLLSAWHLADGDARLLRAAMAVGVRLLAAFQAPGGLPYGSLSLGALSGASQGDTVVLSEAGTLVLEFDYLAEVCFCVYRCPACTNLARVMCPEEAHERVPAECLGLRCFAALQLAARAHMPRETVEHGAERSMFLRASFSKSGAGHAQRYVLLTRIVP